MPVVLNAAAIDQARKVIDPTFTDSPQYVDPALSAELGVETLLKIESTNPIRSFKGRGADLFMQHQQPGIGVIAASAGNFGQGIAYAGRRRDQPVTIFAAETANPSKINRMRALGAELVITGADFDQAKEAAEQAAAATQDAVYVEDGREELIAVGAGTIGAELAALEPDVVVVPVGNGALIGGLGCWFAESPTRVIGVGAAGAPVMVDSWRTQRALRTDTVDTIADGIATRVAIPIAVQWTLDFADEMITVTDDQIRDAMLILHDVSGLVVEPAAAVGAAAIRAHGIAGSRVALVITGSNV